MAHIYNAQLDAYSLYHKQQESDTTSTPLGPALPALGHALAGSTGTAISNLAIYPLELVITRLQVQRSLRKSSTEANEEEYKGIRDAFQQIYNKEGGISAFYSGVVQATGKSIADSFIFFLFYNYMRTKRLATKGNKNTLPALDELVVGALAGACSKLFTTPLSNIVTRKQTSSLISSRSSSPTKDPSVAEIIAQIRSEKGIQGFWSGYSATLVLTLNPSLTFFLYEFFKRSLLPRASRDDPGARVTFLMAAVAKAIASATTYPFALAKARLQTSSSKPIDPPAVEKVKQEFEHVNFEESANKAGHDAKKAAKQSTVFNTVLEIYKKEGAAALYEGVWGEILKGFFSHGMTMLLKESIHKLIIQCYYMVLKALKRFPSPAELAQQAQERAEKAGSAVQQGYEDVSGRVGDAVEQGREVVGDAVQRGKGIVGDAAERAGVVGSNTSEVAKSANDHLSKDAGHLMGNAQEQLGDKIVDVGKALKGVKSEE